jgi:hypothetical protein
MKMKGNDTITANEEGDVSDCAYEEEEEPLPCLCLFEGPASSYNNSMSPVSNSVIPGFYAKTMYS